MTDKIEYRAPTPEQLELMQKYGEVFNSGLDLIMKCELNETLKNAQTRLLESMQHFNTYVICGGALKSDANNEAEISPTMAANRILTMN